MAVISMTPMRALMFRVRARKLAAVRIAVTRYFDRAHLGPVDNYVIR